MKGKLKNKHKIPRFLPSVRIAPFFSCCILVVFSILEPFHTLSVPPPQSVTSGKVKLFFFSLSLSPAAWVNNSSHKLR